MPVRKPVSCLGCPLEKSSDEFVLPTGSGSAGILVVGEAPGAEESRLGVPFVGAAGFFLDRLLRRSGIDRDALLLDNVLRCRPPGNVLRHAHYEHGAINHCRPNLNSSIDSLQPRAIVALGGTALGRLTGDSGILRARGYVLDGPAGPDGRPTPVIGTYHPAFLMPRKDKAETAKDKNPWRLSGIAILDLKFAVKVAKEGLKRIPLRYILDPDVFGIQEFVAEYERALRNDPHGVFLSIDIETPGKLVADDEEELETGLLSQSIVRIGFSFQPGHALSIPWNATTLPFIQRMCSSAGPKVVWNGYAFDCPILVAHGTPLRGVVHDAMWAWKILQSDLPRGLEFVGGVYARDLRPWKHLGSSEPARYNAQDADVALRNFLGIREDLFALNQWTLYDAHVVKLVPVLQLAGRNGLHVDSVAQESLRATLESEICDLQSQVDGAVPRELRSRKSYAKVPENPEGFPVEEVEVVKDIQVCANCGQVATSRTEHLRGGKRKNACAKAEAGFAKEARPVKAWNVVLPFNPLGEDLERYVRHHGHPMGRNARDGRDTLDRKALEVLKKKYDKKHPIYGLALDVRTIRKVLGTFLYQPAADGLLHTDYSLAPSTGRLSSRNPNLQNVTHGGANRFADQIRRTLVPPPGHVFVEADSSAIEAVMSGHFMGDPFYMELAQRGIHDYLTCFELGVAFDNAGIAISRSALNKPVRDRNKRVVHLTNYGGTPRMMAALYPENFPRIADAEKALERYFEACPNLPKWHHETRMQAHRQGFLENPWRRRHYFWHVFGKSRDGKIILGEDGKACIAFLPQSSAADFQQDNALLIADAIKTDKLPFIIPANFLVHDSYCLAVPKGLEGMAAAMLRGILTRPIPEMNGLAIGCEVKTGPNWADMETLHVEVAA